MSGKNIPFRVSVAYPVVVLVVDLDLVGLVPETVWGIMNSVDQSILRERLGCSLKGSEQTTSVSED